jgi:hypothetical protein
MPVLLLVCISTVPKYIYVENIAELLSLQISAYYVSTRVITTVVCQN